MRYCLDTNICIYYLKGLFPSISMRLQALTPGAIAIPAMVKAELLLGAEKSCTRDETMTKVRLFLSPFAIAPFDSDAVETYAQIRAAGERTGMVIGPNDLVIAATALTLGACLVTRNTREFNRIANLRTADWTQ